MSTEVVAEGSRLADTALLKERFALALLLYLFFWAGSALAEEPGEDARMSGRSPIGRAPAQRGPAVLPDKPVATFSTATPSNPPLSLDLDLNPRRGELFGGEFRPRGKSLSAGTEPESDSPYESLPALHSANGWQRLEDYKVRGGIRLLTLWQSESTSLSLQEGHGGVTSLQFTSRTFFGGSSASARAKHGLLDQIFSTTIGENLQRAGKSLTPSRLLRPIEKTDLIGPER
jgi:hypothetical protein